MGVHRDYRKIGLGVLLIGVVMEWAATQMFDWIDLEVLSVNAAARQLYARSGFTQTGQIEDMFRIDGQSLDYTFMSRKIR